MSKITNLSIRHACFFIASVVVLPGMIFLLYAIIEGQEIFTNVSALSIEFILQASLISRTVSVLIIGATLLLYIRKCGVEIRHLLGYRMSILPFRRTLFEVFLIAFILVGVAFAVYYARDVSSSVQGLEISSELLNIYVVTWAMQIVISPILEEITCRGLLQEALAKKYSTIVTILLTSSVFTLMHLGATKLWLILLVGLALSALKYRTKSLWPPMLFHMMWNMSAVAWIVSTASFE